MPEAQNTYTAFILPSYSFRERRAIGEAIVGFIQRRAGDNRGTSGRFKNYEDSYAKSSEFKSFGKRKNNPNVKLTGRMLEDLRVLDVSIPGRIIVGYKSNSSSNDKSVWMREKGFNFVGLSNGELAQILANFPPPLSQQEIVQQVIAVRAPDEDEDGPDN